MKGDEIRGTEFAKFSFNEKYVEKVFLNGVGLDHIPAGVLSRLHEVTELHLNDNEIETIEADAFDGCTKLTYLNLRNNPLKMLHPSTFDTLISLKELDIGKNYCACERLQKLTHCGAPLFM